jgi:hypothetical protein
MKRLFLRLLAPCQRLSSLLRLVLNLGSRSMVTLETGTFPGLKLGISTVPRAPSKFPRAEGALKRPSRNRRRIYV